MFLVKIMCSFIRIVFIAIFVSNCFCFQHKQTTISMSDEKKEIENATLLINTKKCSREEIQKNSKELFVKSNPFAYRRLHFKEGMEKIQVMDNGTVMKSAYIPVISNDSVLKYSDHGKELIDNEGWKQKSDSPSSLRTNFKRLRSEDLECKGLIYKTNIMPLSKMTDINSLLTCNISKISPAVLINSTKENFIMKNGKKYRIVKVKKNRQNIGEKQSKNQIQRRTFKPLPNLLSILPLKWMTRQQKNETRLETKSNNITQRLKFNPEQNSEENSKEVAKNGIENGGKIKRLLNLFTIIKFDNGECYADGMKGTCLHQVECDAKGGKFAATCAEDLGVCCYNEKTCGETSNDNNTYFINEGFPDSSTVAPKVCTLKVVKATSDIKQLRLDFQNFQLREPTNGTCLHDRLIITGQNINNVIPEICGSNTGQHVYVDIEDAKGPFNLNVVTVGEYFPRNFRIKVTQLRKEDELIAPKNCLQYHAEPSGFVQTFNYPQDVNENEEEIINGYFNNLNYAICIKKHNGFCSISYENEDTGTRSPTFQLVNTDEDGERLLPPRQAGAESFDCPDDYIVINGIRLCGEKLNDASIDLDYTRNYPVTDTSNGPFILFVRTDTAVSGRGFYLKYVQNPCFT